MVNGESVEKACSEVGEYSDEQMVSEFDRFFRAQPAICDFIVELTHESGQKIQALSLFLSYSLSRTERQALSVLRERGVLSLGQLCIAVWRQEEQVFMGDTSFYRMMGDLFEARHHCFA
jgi:hypothetical protein